MAAGRRLFVFDFDHTLIDDNTDTWIMEVRPELRLREGLRALRRQFPCWTDLMDDVFSKIHRAGCGKEEILEHVGRLRFYEQSTKAVKAVADSANAHSIIISDSNSVFINQILSREGLQAHCSHIFTNPARFDDSGRLHVNRFHSHSCQRCARSPNMCKGAILAEFVRNSEEYSRIVYVGDGRGDYCPCVGLRETDVVVCREGYGLAEQLVGPSGREVRATVQVINFKKSLGDCIAQLCKET